jgi:hypothetical protein
LAVAVLHPVSAFLWPSISPSVIGKNADRIAVGMTANEVTGLIGAPPGDYSTGLTYSYRSNKRVPLPEWSAAEWLTDDRDIGVFLVDCGRVVELDLYGARKAPAFDNLQWHLRRHWQRWFPEK